MPPAQWAGRLRNLPGLRQDEVEWPRLDDLLATFPKDARIRGNELLAGINARSLRLSVIPATVQGKTQLDLRPVDSIYWPRLPRARSRRLKQVVAVLRDPFLGYSMECRCWDDPFGAMEIWMIYDHRGELIRTRAAPITAWFWSANENNSAPTWARPEPGNRSAMRDLSASIVARTNTACSFA